MREYRFIWYLTILPLVLLCCFALFINQDCTGTLHTCCAKISRFIDFLCDVWIQYFSYHLISWLLIGKQTLCLFWCALCFGLLILIVFFFSLFMFICTHSLDCSIFLLVYWLFYNILLFKKSSTGFEIIYVLEKNTAYELSIFCLWQWRLIIIFMFWFLSSQLKHAPPTLFILVEPSIDSHLRNQWLIKYNKNITERQKKIYPLSRLYRNENSKSQIKTKE